jgi:hypothetical protein
MRHTETCSEQERRAEGRCRRPHPLGMVGENRKCTGSVTGMRGGVAGLAPTLNGHTTSSLKRPTDLTTKCKDRSPA